MTDVSSQAPPPSANGNGRKPPKVQSGSAARAGVGFGSALAITISWSLHQSILWAILHGILGWIYVLYHAITR